MSRSGQLGDNTYAGQNPRYVQPLNFQQRDRTHLVNTPVITWYLGLNTAGNASLEITSADGRTRSLPVPARPGITRYAWDGRMTAAAATGGRRGGGAGRGAAAGGETAAAPNTANEEGGAAFSGGGRGAPPPRLAPGNYSIKLTLGSDVATGALAVREDPILKP
jgi:hypothetical protein